MAITITVTGDTPLEALAALTAFGIRCMSNKDVSAAANRIYEAEMHKEAKLAASQAAEQPAREGTPEPVSDTPREPYVEEPPFEAGPDINRVTGDPAPEPEPEQKPKPAKVPKLEEVRAAGIDAAKKYGQAKVKAILEKFGVPNMTSLAEQDRAAFLEALEGLGEDNA